MNRAERVVRRIDRFQQGHAVLGFPFAVIQKYGNDQAGARAALVAYYGLFALFPLLLLAGYLTSALFIAQRARTRWGNASATGLGATLGYTALALAILLLAGKLPLVGHLVLVLATIAGVGGCVVHWRHRRRPGAPPAAAAA